MKAVVAAFNQEKALVGALSVITNLRMDLFEALGHSIGQVNKPSVPSLLYSLPMLLSAANRGQGGDMRPK